MKIVAIGYFNTGFSIGLDDYLFQQVESSECQEFFNKFPFPRVDRPTAYPNGNRLGKGLSFDLSQSLVLSDWWEGGKRIVESSDFCREFSLTPDIRSEVRNLLLSENPQPSLFLTVYTCGTALIELVIDRVDDHLNGVAALRYVQLFEYAAFNMYESHTEFQLELLSAATSLLNFFQKKSSANIKKITELSLPVGKEELLGSLIPSFTLFFFSSEQTVIDDLKQYCLNNGDQVTDVHICQDCVFGSWYIWGGCSMDTTSQCELLDTIKLYTLYYGASESLEKLLTSKISQLVNDSNVLKDEIIQLQTISNILVNNTNLQITTQNGEYIAVLNVMENMGHLHVFHEAILRSIGVLADIQCEIANENDKKAALEEQRRNAKINKFVVIITSFTFVSVLADFFNLDQYSSTLIGNWYMRMGIYFIFLIIGVCFISWLLNSTIAMSPVVKEKIVIEKMIRLYCRKKEKNNTLCPECHELLQYVHTRLDRCPFGDKKGSCRKCKIHCYKPEMRERIKTVMRYSGPRMLIYTPWITIRHWFK